MARSCLIRKPFELLQTILTTMKSPGFNCEVKAYVGIVLGNIGKLTEHVL
jgi:hypothetical protein